MDVKVDIEYCAGCGYLSHFEELAEKIRSTVPTANVIGKEGRTGAFEVTVNGMLIYSKLRTMAFPHHTDVVEVVNEAAEGKEIKPVTSHQPVSCTIQ